MNREKIVAISVAVVAVIGIVIYLVFSGPSHPNGAANIPGGTAGGQGVSDTRAPAPANVTVPNEGDTSAPANVAVPTVQTPGDAAGNTEYRSFDIKASSNMFTPSTIIGKVGDTLDIEFTAVDKNYDFTQPDFGFKVGVAKGQTQKIQFQASAAGKFTFYCASCGGPGKGPVGYIIVAAK